MQIERTFTHQNTKKLCQFHNHHQYKHHPHHYNHPLYHFNHQQHEHYDGGLLDGGPHE